MFRRERSLHQSGHTDLFLNYPNSQFYLAFMSRQRGEDVKEGKREKAEGEKEKQGVLEEAPPSTGLCFQSGDCDHIM